ncbi:MAG: ComEC/Rec2 family competence protein [Bacillota bacterium]
MLRRGLTGFLCLFVLLTLASCTPPPQPLAPTGALEAHILDVGQGDAAAIRVPNGDWVLVDGGPRARSGDVVAALKGLGVTRLAVVVATHPHEDHIGGLPAVLDAFPVGAVYLPRVEHTSVTYERLLEAIKQKAIPARAAKGGVGLELGPDVRAMFLGPVRDNYSDLNDWSAVLRLALGEHAILLTADATAVSEGHMLPTSWAPLESTVLRVGHHGSAGSSSAAFLEAVKPRYAIISVGAGNTYGHPAQAAVDRLSAAGAAIYRTDLTGTITVTITATGVTIKTAR